jgi:hypothetical protein
MRCMRRARGVENVQRLQPMRGTHSAHLVRIAYCAHPECALRTHCILGARYTQYDELRIAC